MMLRTESYARFWQHLLEGAQQERQGSAKLVADVVEKLRLHPIDLRQCLSTQTFLRIGASTSEPDSSLIRGDIQKNCLGLPREIGSLRRRDYHADFVLAARSERDDRKASVSKRVSCSRRPFPQFSTERVVERLTDGSGIGHERSEGIVAHHLDQIAHGMV